MNFIRTLWRMAKVIVRFNIGGLVLLFTRPHTRPERAAWLSNFCAGILASIDVHVFTHGPIPMHGALVANHTTFLDVISHSAMRPCVFVSKIELRSTPLLGWMSLMSGTVYVDRGHGGSAEAASQGMAKGFRDGLPVVFFPEGTTGNGEQPTLPFHSGLIAESMESGAPIFAGFTRYKLDPRDLSEGRSLQQNLFWGKQSLPLMVWRTLQLRRVEIHIRFADAPIAFSEAALTDRKIAAEEARAAVDKLSETPAI